MPEAGAGQGAAGWVTVCVGRQGRRGAGHCTAREKGWCEKAFSHQWKQVFSFGGCLPPELFWRGQARTIFLTCPCCCKGRGAALPAGCRTRTTHFSSPHRADASHISVTLPLAPCPWDSTPCTQVIPCDSLWFPVVPCSPIPCPCLHVHSAMGCSPAFPCPLLCMAVWLSEAHQDHIIM